MSIPAHKAIVGERYRNPRGAIVTVVSIPETKGSVISIRLGALGDGAEMTVPWSFPLEPLVDTVTAQDLAHGPLPAIRAALPELGVAELEDLADLDERAEVQELVRARLEALRQAAADQAPAAAPPSSPATAPAVPELTAAELDDLTGAIMNMYPDRAGHLAKIQLGNGPGQRMVTVQEILAMIETGKRIGRCTITREHHRQILTHLVAVGEQTVAAVAARRQAKAAEAAAAAPTPAATPDVPTLANERIKLIRTFTTIAQCNAAEAWPNYQAPSLDPEIANMVSCLNAIELNKEHAPSLQRLAASPKFEKRPGALAVIRERLAVLQGQGVEVIPSIAPVTEAAEAARLPEGPFTPEAPPPASHREIFDRLLLIRPRTRVWTREQLETIGNLIGSVRSSRAALPLVEDLDLLRLAWRVEDLGKKRPTILAQVRARIEGLGGPPPAQEDLVERVDSVKATEIPADAAPVQEDSRAIGKTVKTHAATEDETSLPPVKGDLLADSSGAGAGEIPSGQDVDAVWESVEDVEQVLAHIPREYDDRRFPCTSVDGCTDLSVGNVREIVDNSRRIDMPALKELWRWDALTVGLEDLASVIQGEIDRAGTATTIEMARLAHALHWASPLDPFWIIVGGPTTAEVVRAGKENGRIGGEHTVAVKEIKADVTTWKRTGKVKLTSAEAVRYCDAFLRKIGRTPDDPELARIVADRAAPEGLGLTELVHKRFLQEEKDGRIAPERVVLTLEGGAPWTFREVGIRLTGWRRGELEPLPERLARELLDAFDGQVATSSSGAAAQVPERTDADPAGNAPSSSGAAAPISDAGDVLPDGKSLGPDGQEWADEITAIEAEAVASGTKIEWQPATLVRETRNEGERSGPFPTGYHNPGRSPRQAGNFSDQDSAATHQAIAEPSPEPAAGDGEGLERFDLDHPTPETVAAFTALSLERRARILVQVDGNRREPWDRDGDVAEEDGYLAHGEGAPVDANPYRDEFYRQAWASGWRDADTSEREPRPPMTLARALEIAGDGNLQDLEDLEADERSGYGDIRGPVALAIAARREQLATADLSGEMRIQRLRARIAAATSPAELDAIETEENQRRGTVYPVVLHDLQVRRRELAAKAPPPRFQVKDLRHVDLPDGTRDLWVHGDAANAGKPRRLGNTADPALAQAVALYDRHLAETKGPTTGDHLAAAMSALQQLALGLPAMRALGMDVTITISTRRE